MPTKIMKSCLTNKRIKFPVNFVVLILLLAVGVLHISAQVVDKKIDEIRRIYNATNEKIAKAEKDFAVSEIFMTELIVNKGGTSYPAVGTYKQTVKFYYTYGDREADPYPNRILKITVKTQSAARQMYSEFLFDEQEEMIFYFTNDSESENRLYFSSDKLIRWQKDEQIESIKDAEAKELVKQAKYQTNRVVQIFKNSL